jgi:hypothetical protein
MFCLPSLQTSDGFTCPSIHVNNNINTVELDPAAIARLLQEDNTSRETHLPIQSESPFLPTTDKRKLQLEVIDKTNSQVTTVNIVENVVQIYFLKNRKYIHDPEIYSKVQSVVIKDIFYSTLGDKLKDYPQVTKKTPLISLQFFSQTLQKKMQIYNIKDMSKIQVTELKIGSQGYLYCMILPFDSSGLTSRNLMGLHVKYGIDYKNNPATWKRKYRVEDPNWIIYFNIDDLPLTGDKTKYTFYYYSTDKRIEELAGATEVRSVDFEIWKVAGASPSTILKLASTWALLLLVLFVI